MSNSEEAFFEIRRYFNIWVSEVAIANANGYFDINKVSEGTALCLLNLIFGFELRDLNQEKSNYPGIDLGDDKKAMVAFQVTSRTDNTKLLSSLTTFISKGYKSKFSNGIRFLIINSKKDIKRGTKKFADFNEIFDPKKDVYYPEDLIKKIEQLYYEDKKRFNEIKRKLRDEFEFFKSNNSILDFSSISEKYIYYKEVLTEINRDLLNDFVEFQCSLGSEKFRQIIWKISFLNVME